MAAPASGPPSEPPSDPLTGELDLRSTAETVTSLTRATAIMSVGTALSRITGFLRLAVIAWAIGGAESKLPDTYNLANTMPNIVYQLVLGEILATLFVPVFIEHLTTRAKDEAWRIASTILNLAILIAAAISAVAVLLAPWIIKIYTFRLHGQERIQQEAVGGFLLRLLLPQMIFYAAGAVMTGLLNAHRKFAAPMFAPLLNNLIVMITFVAFHFLHSGPLDLTHLTFGDKLLLGGGTSLGVITMTVVLWPFVLKLKDQAYSPRALEWRNPAIRRVGTLAKWSLGYVIVNQIGLWIVYALANGRAGGVTAFQSSFILYQLPYGIFAVSVFTALVPTLSEHHVRGDVPSFRRDLSLGVRTTLFIIVPAAAGFIALSRPIVKLLLEHGVFSGRSTQLFADTFLYMAIGLAAYAVFQQLMRASYARQDTKTPWIVNSAAVVFNTALNFPLFAAMGVPGLALAHAISYIFAAVLGGIVLRRQLGGIDGTRLASSTTRITVAAAASGVGAWVVGRALDAGTGAATLVEQMLQVGAAVAAGLAIYAGLAAAMRLDEFRPLLRMVAGRFGRRAEA
ncbi:MAG: murein biosynthesis integral membrane protein MurJ [Actinomycetota bacterium]